MRNSRSIVVCGLVLASIKLFLLPFREVLPAELLVLLESCGLTLLIAVAAWRASNRSQLYARVLWRCVVVVALLWTLNFVVAAFGHIHALAPMIREGWTIMVINSLPLGLALTLPLLLREDRSELKIGWLQAIDIAQLGVIVFSAFLVFLYIPSLGVASNFEQMRYFRGMHLMRDGFLALGYLYRGSRSAFPDLRRLHFRMSGFLLAYGLGAVLALHAVIYWHWSPMLAYLITDLPVLGLLLMAATWKQGDRRPREEDPADRQGVVWTQVLALVMPASVVALDSQITGRGLRMAGTLITASFFLYAIRLLVMQHHQTKTLSSLAVMEERFSKAFKSSPAAITLSRLSDNRLIDANDRWLGLMNLTREQAIGKTSLELGIFENRDEHEKLVGALRDHGTLRGMTLHLVVEGRALETLVSAEVMELEGEPLLIASHLDVTEVKSLTQQLQQAQKMELVGSLAGGIAHDFNNLLTIISGYSSLALNRKLDAESEAEFRHIKEASGKASALTRQLLAFSRRQVLQPRHICLNSVVSSIQKLLERTIGDNIELITSLRRSGTVYADPVQIEQVVMNLAINARDAMPHGGKVMLETRNLDLTAPYPERALEIPAGRYVMLIVSDTGTGIRPEDLDRIFEPFFTTKEAGRGTGLGLSTVYGIVKQSGGYIWADSEVGAGTTVKVCLPRVDVAADAIQVDHKESENLTGAGTVLVVDNDTRVCELTAKILGQYGYHVITANSGKDAERRACEFDKEIDLLVTDLVMPGTSGLELAERLKATRPGMRTIYMSGYPHIVVSREKCQNSCEPTLPKPFAPAQLAQEAKKVLSDYSHPCGSPQRREPGVST